MKGKPAAVLICLVLTISVPMAMFSSVDNASLSSADVSVVDTISRAPVSIATDDGLNLTLDQATGKVTEIEVDDTSVCSYVNTGFGLADNVASTGYGPVTGPLTSTGNATFSSFCRSTQSILVSKTSNRDPA